MKKIILILLLIPFALQASLIVDPNRVIMTTKTIPVQTVNGVFMEVMPTGLTPLIDGYSVVYPNAVNPKLSGNCTLKLLVKIANITTVRSWLQSNSLDSGAVTSTAYAGAQ
jgi:hypothetical protein